MPKTKRRRSEHKSSTPVPFLPWQVVVQSFNPGSEPTQGRYRTLKSNRRSTAGVTVTRRKGRRAEGRETVHSVFVVLSAQARRAGDTTTADALLAEATQIEDRFAEPMKVFLAYRSLDALHEAPFYESLMQETESSLARFERWNDLPYAFGSVASLTNSTALLHAVNRQGEEVDVSLPRRLLDSWNLHRGDDLLVFQHLLGRSVLVEVLPVARASETSLSLAEEKAALARVRTRGLSATDRDALDQLEAGGNVSRRSLRPAG